MLILQTPRLRLRWFTEDDAEFMLRLFNDPGWLANIGDRGVRTRRQAANWIRTRHVAAYGRLGFGFWGVERIADGALVGMCGLIQRDTLPHADVGYALLPAFRGRGYAREAAAACVRYAEEVLGLPELWGTTAPDNHASGAILRELGMKDEGLRQLPGSEEPVRVFRGPARDLGDDRTQIDALAGRFFAAFTNRDGAIPTLAALPHHFATDAVVRQVDVLGTPVSTDLHGFIAPRAELLLRGRLQAFEEHETEARTDLAGGIAQRWSRYAKRGVLDGRPFEGRGTKTLQLVKTRRGWKIGALAWQDDAG